MKKITLLVLLALGLAGFAHATLAEKPDKVTICHATESESNPWVRIVTSENGISGHFENNGTPKAGHEDDLLFEGEVDCPEVEDPEDPPVDEEDPPVDEDPGDEDPGDEDGEDEDVPPEDTDDTPVADGNSGSGDGNNGEPNRGGGGGDNDDNEVTPQVGGVSCEAVTTAPTNFAVESGIPNDNTLELYWDVVPNADRILIVYGYENGVWLFYAVAPNTGHYSLGGLQNKTHYWAQIVGFNECSNGLPSEAIDPLP